MKKISLAERAIQSISERMNPVIGPLRQKKLTNTDFTIIANNCWAGICYEWFGLPKQSPTIGMYFYPDEYIRFLSDLKRYLSTDIVITTADESKYRDELIKKGQGNVLIGKLDDVEFTLLHYHDKTSAKEKWNRRVERICWDNMIYKFSYMNGCADEHIHEFEKTVSKMPLNRWGGIKSVVFAPKPFNEYKDIYYVEADEDGQIGNDTFYWNRYCDVFQLINETGI